MMRAMVVCSVVVASVAMAQQTQQQGQRRGPPAEALAACNGLAAGAACGFTHHGKNLTGTCRTGPNGEAAACAPEGMGPGGPGGHHGPPPEAVAACNGQSAGATCSVTFDGRTMTGTCRTGPDGQGSLACAPQGGPGGPGGHHGPPPEALAACSGQSAGASCSVNLHGQATTGTCVAGPNGEALACMPPRP